MLCSKKCEANLNEKVFQKKNQIEQILDRPHLYIGSVNMIEEQLWVYDQKKDKMVNRTVKYVPGLLKIFDEILVNASDNVIRKIPLYPYLLILYS